MTSSKAGAFALGFESRSPFVPMFTVFLLALFAVDTSHRCIRKKCPVQFGANSDLSSTRCLPHLRIFGFEGTSAPLGQQGNCFAEPGADMRESAPFPWKQRINDGITGAR